MWKINTFKTIAAFLLTLSLCALLSTISIRNTISAEREQIEKLIVESSYRLNEVISRQLYRTQALAALVIKGDGTVENFQEIAEVIAGDVPALAAFLLAPDGIVTDAYPLEDNPTVVGLNLLDEADHYGNREAIKARETGTLVMGGPFILRSGIMGLTGRYPVYISTESGENKFWGLVAVSLKFPEALDDAGLSMLEYQGLSYELWRINPDTDERQIVATNSEHSSNNTAYVERHVGIHHADWYFRVFSLTKWYQSATTWITLLGSLSISLIAAFLMQARSNAILHSERKQSEYKISIMLSQIQPHFLYNSLTAIAQLCDEDPMKAKKATIDFSAYLRGNMDSLGDTELISIEKELSHVRGYLDLEVAIYGSALVANYEINSGGFLLPPLTIQPIVENAVKHGIGKKEGGGSITLSVNETDKYFVVSVVDDGSGFNEDIPQHDDRIHIGIVNVRRRIEEQCGGTLEITSEAGRGTTAVISIPKERT